MLLLGRTPSECLPPGERVLEMLRTLPELQYPADSNAAEKLTTETCGRGLAAAVAYHTRTGSIACGELAARVN